MDLPLTPNWRYSVRDSATYLTTIFSTDSGREQRTAERINPRRTVEFQAILQGDRLRDMRARLETRRDRILYVPEPVNQLASIQTYAPLGQRFIICDTELSENLIGRRVCIQAQGKQVFNDIEAVSGNRVSLRDPLSAEGRKGDSFRLCIPGRVGKSARLRYVTDDVATFRVSIEQDAGIEVHDYGHQNAPLFQGREVFTEQPNWARPPNIEIVGEYELTDFKRGVVESYAAINFPMTITQFTFLGRKRDKVGRIVDFYNRHMGRLHEFWCPSWTSDLRITGDVAAGSSSFEVEGRGAANQFAASLVNRAVAIQMYDDTWQFLSVEDVSTDGSVSKFRLGNKITSKVLLNNVKGIYWMNVSRLATDKATVEWVTDDVAQMVLQIATLETLPAENI